MEEAASLDDFADKPLVVLTAGSGSDAAHLASQNELATLSTNSVHRVIDGAAHEALVADEDGRRHHRASDPRRRLIGPDRRTAGRVIRSALVDGANGGRASPSTSLPHGRSCQPPERR